MKIKTIIRTQKKTLLTTFICFFLCYFLAFNTHAQESHESAFPKLTQEQMLADFDYFVNTIKTISPQNKVRATVTGIDPNKELEKMRSKIKNIKTTAQFLKLIQSSIAVLQDGHSSLLWPAYSSEDLRESKVSEAGIALFPSYYNFLYAAFKKKKFNLKLTYLDGEYYNILPFKHNGTTFNSGLRLHRINGKKAAKFISKLYPFLRNMRWDYTNKRYYSEYFYRAYNLLAEDVLVLEFKDANNKTIKGNFLLSDKINYDKELVISKDKKVEYFPDSQVLYVRMPKMDLDFLEYYPKEIAAKASGKPLKNVIIDIRDNPGGTDNVWVAVLKAIIAKPINFELLLLALPSDEMKKIYAKDSPNWKTYTAPFLNNSKYSIFESGPRSIEPTANSLNYNGKINLLTNKNIYSSSGAFAAVGMLSDQINTVGENTGKLLGRGINPLVFELPNSKILYRIEPVIDFQNVNSARDVYHDDVEIPVSLSIEEYLKRLNYKGDIYGKDFLFNHDPVFIKALKN